MPEFKAAEFIRLLQLTRDANQCMGRECLSINESVHESARAIDDKAEKMPETCRVSGHDSSICDDCRELTTLGAGLTASLSAIGVELPPGLAVVPRVTPSHTSA